MKKITILISLLTICISTQVMASAKAKLHQMARLSTQPPQNDVILKDIRQGYHAHVQNYHLKHPGQLKYVQNSSGHTNPNGTTDVLFWALATQNPETIKILLEDGVNPNQPNQFGETALNVAIQLLNYDVVKILLDHGAQKELRSNSTQERPRTARETSTWALTNAPNNPKALRIFNLINNIDQQESQHPSSPTPN